MKLAWERPANIVSMLCDCENGRTILWILNKKGNQYKVYLSCIDEEYELRAGSMEWVERHALNELRNRMLARIGNYTNIAWALEKVWKEKENEL